MVTPIHTHRPRAAYTYVYSVQETNSLSLLLATSMPVDALVGNVHTAEQLGKQIPGKGIFNVLS